MALSSLTHGQEIKKRGVFVGIQQAAGCCLQGTSFQMQMLKSQFSGLDSNIIYKTQISLFTDVTSRERCC